MLVARMLDTTAPNFVAGKLPPKFKVAQEMNLDFWVQPQCPLKAAAPPKAVFIPMVEKNSVRSLSEFAKDTVNGLFNFKEKYHESEFLMPKKPEMNPTTNLPPFPKYKKVPPLLEMKQDEAIVEKNSIKSLYEFDKDSINGLFRFNEKYRECEFVMPKKHEVNSTINLPPFPKYEKVPPLLEMKQDEAIIANLHPIADIKKAAQKITKFRSQDNCRASLQALKQPTQLYTPRYKSESLDSVDTINSEDLSSLNHKETTHDETASTLQSLDRLLDGVSPVEKNSVRSLSEFAKDRVNGLSSFNEKYCECEFVMPKKHEMNPTTNLPPFPKYEKVPPLLEMEQDETIIANHYLIADTKKAAQKITKFRSQDNCRASFHALMQPTQLYTPRYKSESLDSVDTINSEDLYSLNHKETTQDETASTLQSLDSLLDKVSQKGNQHLKDVKERPAKHHHRPQDNRKDLRRRLKLMYGRLLCSKTENLDGTDEMNSKHLVCLKLIQYLNHQAMTHDDSSRRLQILKPLHKELSLDDAPCKTNIKEVLEKKVEDSYKTNINKVPEKNVLSLESCSSRSVSEPTLMDWTELSFNVDKTEKETQDPNETDFKFLSCLEDSNAGEGLEYFMSGVRHVLHGNKKDQPGYQLRPRLFFNDSTTKPRMRWGYLENCEWEHRLLDPSVRRIWNTPLIDTAIGSILDSTYSPAAKMDPSLEIWKYEKGTKSQSVTNYEKIYINDSIVQDSSSVFHSKDEPYEWNKKINFKT